MSLSRLQCPTDRLKQIEHKVLNLYRTQPFPNYHVKLSARYVDRFNRLYGCVGLPLKMLPNLTVLDGGCGTGEESLNLARLGCKKVTGLDMSDASLALARESAQTLGLTNLEFVRGSLLDIPFAPESFDVVVSHGVIHHTGDPERALANLVRVLKPGGFLSLFVYNKYAHVVYNFERFIVHRIAGDDLDRRVKVARRLFGWRFRQQVDGWDLQAKLYDQYAHPQASDHTLGQVLKWFRHHGLEYQGCYPPIDLKQLVGQLSRRTAAGEFALRGRLFRPFCHLAAALEPLVRSGGTEDTPRYPSVLRRGVIQAGLLLLGLQDYSIGVTIGGRKL